jgi:catechol 2,3-dioxygenase-like lactoylglutathione lyase family enzyme
MLRRTVLGLLAPLAGLCARSAVPAEREASKQKGKDAMLKFVGPLIAVEDVARSRRFYEGLLGQKVKYDFGRDVAFEGDFTIHQRSHFQELLGGAERHPVVTKAHNGELYFETGELELYAERLAQAGVEFIHGIQEQPWAQRVTRFYDPDGHVIEIAEPMEAVVRRLHGQGMPTDAIQKKTHLPAEFVERALGGR